MEQSLETPKKDKACVSCRWLGLWPRPYGSIEYFCSRDQEAVPSHLVDRRRCPDFEL